VSIQRMQIAQVVSYRDITKPVCLCREVNKLVSALWVSHGLAVSGKMCWQWIHIAGVYEPLYRFK